MASICMAIREAWQRRHDKVEENGAPYKQLEEGVSKELHSEPPVAIIQCSYSRTANSDNQPASVFSPGMPIQSKLSNMQSAEEVAGVEPQADAVDQTPAPTIPAGDDVELKAASPAAKPPAAPSAPESSRSPKPRKVGEPQADSADQTPAPTIPAGGNIDLKSASLDAASSGAVVTVEQEPKVTVATQTRAVLPLAPEARPLR